MSGPGVSGPGAPFRGPWTPRPQDPPTPTLADHFMSADNPFQDPPPGLRIVFTDGSFLIFPNVRDDDWDYEAGMLTLIRNRQEHTWPLGAIAYMRYDKPPDDPA